jgi:uncharacterized damage-inducible protein DinB
MDLLDRLLGHDHWATSQLLDASRGLTDAQLDEPFDLGRGSLRETLDHTIFVIDFWTRLMVGQPATTERAGRRSIAALIEEHEHYSAAFAAFARRVRDEQRLDDTFVDHHGRRWTLGGTIIHVIHHDAQHRGEARHMLERLGVPDLWDGDPLEWEQATRGI